MVSAQYPGPSAATTKIALHATGHERAHDGTLLRIDYERGLGWVATHYDLSLHVIQQIRGSEEDVHRVAACWARDEESMRLRTVQFRPAVQSATATAPIELLKA